jgi:hypothetical protein
MPSVAAASMDDGGDTPVGLERSDRGEAPAAGGEAA